MKTIVTAVVLLSTPLIAAPPETAQVPQDHAAKMAAGTKLFKQSVKRILAGRCLKCHGGDDKESGFSLATRRELLAGGSNGPAVVIGKSRRSRLLRMIQHSLEPHMPADGAKLSPREIKDIAAWIDLGAPYDKSLKGKADPTAWTRRVVDQVEKQYWAFQPLRHPRPPAARSPWVRNTIDRFVLRRLRIKKLQPNSAASPQQLARRIYLDVTGLPPSPAEITQYLASPRPDRYRQLVDQLLTEPSYGEKWARHWLDVARFAESYGFEHDTDRKFAFYYRDFVIKAFNAGMPYNRFVRLQIAGDEVDPQDPTSLIATGFLGAGVFPTQITKNEVERTRYDALDDMLATIGTSMLGLTIGCARCHDHKFDPIPQADYYRMLSTFTTTVRSEIKVDLAGWLGSKKKTVRTIMICGEGHKPVRLNTQGKDYFNTTFFLNRGDTDQKLTPAKQGFLQVLMTPVKPQNWIVTPPSRAKRSYRRLSFAKWLTDTQSGAGHLLARVIVNRLWYHHFGRGIVNSPNDFGRQGQPPTHPELLDWLAGELIRHDWDLKAIHRLILTSAAYRQSRQSTREKQRVDPTNRWYSRFQRRRLEAESIRDSLMAVAGELRREMYGKGTLNPLQNRRSIYFTIKRSRLVRMLQLFDAPEPLVSIGNRPATTIAPQALLFMNSPLVRKCAKSLAQRILRNKRHAHAEQVTAVYNQALARSPRKDELSAGVSFLKSQTRSYESTDAQQRALADYCQVVLGLNEFIYPD